MVNGVTGKRDGTAPYSWVKITAAIVFGGLALFAAYVYLTEFA